MTATHVLGTAEVELARGDLTLAPTASSQPSAAQPVLLLTVGGAAFPLYQATTFGTVADNERVYLFKPEIQDASVPAGG